ncbi:hypothetical protein, partial [Stutzerimonas kunmingensis]|uniref:hypothetical protein n=1 Tax=Stutzerimonas kunmingensis TaxID=1211807 RepID=UPI0021027BA7
SFIQMTANRVKKYRPYERYQPQLYKDARQKSRLSRFFNPTPPAITLALFSSVMASHVPAK